MTNVSCLVLQYAFLDPRFLNPFAIFHVFDTSNLGSFSLSGVGFSVFKQALGTDALRNGLHENTWVNALMADYKPGPFCPDAPAEDDIKYPNWIITDTRFPNEAQAIKKACGIVIRVDRPGIKAINAHPSETGLDDWDFDYKIWNGSDLKSLMVTITNILQKENIWLRK